MKTSSITAWLKEGDCNTRFFHSKVYQRRNTNSIKNLREIDGRWWRGWANCEKTIINYFSGIFSSSNPFNIHQVCNNIRGRLSEEYKLSCAKPYSEDEVK